MASTQTQKVNVDAFNWATPELKEYLAGHSVDSYIAKKVSDLIVIDCTQTAQEALRTLLDKGISSAPVYYDCDDETDFVSPRFRYLGFVDVSDLSAMAVKTGLAKERKGKGMMTKLSKWFNPDTSDVVAAAVNLSKTNPFTSVAPGTTLSTVFPLLAGGVHRVAIQNPKNGEVVGLITQSQVVRLLSGRSTLLGSLRAASLADIFESDPKFKEVYCISEMAAAKLAFARMLELGLSAMPLLDDEFRVVTVLSASDIRAMATMKEDEFDILSKPCIEFVTAMRERTEANAIAKGRDPGLMAPSNGGVRRCITVNTNDSFGTLLNLFATSRLHRVYVVDNDGRPMGVIALTDCLQALISVDPTSKKPTRIASSVTRPATTAAGAGAGAGSASATTD